MKKLLTILSIILISIMCYAYGCYLCGGTGSVREKCISCNGEGYAFGNRCWACQGDGYTSTPCPLCEGKGYTKY